MIEKLYGKGIIAVCLFLSLFLTGCTRPEDNAINKEDDTTPAVIVPQKTGPEVYTIEIDNMQFHPDVVTVHVGDTIVWLNKDLVTHCVTEAGNSWTSSKIPGGASWKMVANNSSDYYCAIHMVMKGKIVVE